MLKTLWKLWITLRIKSYNQNYGNRLRMLKALDIPVFFRWIKSGGARSEYYMYSS